MVSFAGFTNAGRFQDTWRLDATTETWTEVTPASGNPAARCLHSASYDAINHRMIMYGGQISGAQDDIWAFDLTAETWTELTPAVSPLGRWFAANVYDAANHRVVIFGGDRGVPGGGVTNEVQLFHLNRNEWQELVVPGVEPTPRAAQFGVYVPGEDRMVILGGNDGSNWLNEVWSLDGLSTAVATPLPATPSPSSLRTYPNPFRAVTTLDYDAAGATSVSLSIYDVVGRLLRTVVDDELPAGDHTATWDGRDAQGHRVTGGTYFVRLEAGGEVRTGKVVFLGD
jgi:hypothetical protein